MARRRILSPPALAILAALVVVFALAAFASTPSYLSRALESQRQTAIERPQDAAVFNDLGNLLVLSDQQAEAEEAYRKALQLDPNKVSALFNLGLLEQQKGEKREALRLYRKAVELQPDHAWANYQIGTLYESWKQNDKAIAHYARAFELDPQLAFKESNPHIVENRLVTQAMLIAYQDGGRHPQAPRLFDEPGRIARLLVPKPPSEAEAASKSKPAAEGQTAGAQTNAGQGTGQPTVLDPSDLRGGANTGQAIPQAGSRTGRGSMRQPTAAQRGLRQWERPEPNNIAPPPMDSPEGRGGLEPTLPAPGGAYYRPGAPSSSRLRSPVTPEGETGEG